MYNLKSLQSKELDILLAVHDACEKMGIEYVICYGTLLGAVRHKGFIPWDDDIDICMKREDYDIFIKDGMKYLPDNLVIQHWSTEKECPNIFAKVRNKNTTFLHREHVNLDICQGVFIDVFPLDRIKEGKLAVWFELKRRKVFHDINVCYDTAFLKNVVKRPISKAIVYLIHYVYIPTFRRKSRSYYISLEEQRIRNNHKKGGDCTVLSILDNITSPYNLFEKRCLLEFEGHKLWGPQNYEKILTILFGDYMKIPPKEKQIIHRPLFVDLTKGYTGEEIKKLLNDNQEVVEQSTSRNN